jgi:threonine dehydrogenase-like Zn-dependent dehydrogenase
MKSLVYSAINTVTLADRPEPTPRPDEVVLNVRATGICGSDMAGFLGLSPRRQPGLVLGHEVIGTVAQMPASVPPDGGVWPFGIGQRVVVNPIMPCGTCAACKTGQPTICASWRLIGMDDLPGGFAERVAVAAANVFPLPDDLPDERAVMIEPLANGVRLFNHISCHQFGTLAVFGAGTQGSLLVSLARLLGYREIAVVDVNPQRLEVARGLGAKYLIDARSMDTVATIRQTFGGLGADIVIDAYGGERSRSEAVNACRKGGEILLLGLHDTYSRVDFNAIVRNELRLQGSFCYTPQEFARSKQLIENGDIDLSRWTESLPLEQGQAAFDKLVTDPGPTMKIMLTP